jgi:hypothetical protein
MKRGAKHCLTLSDLPSSVPPDHHRPIVFDVSQCQTSGNGTGQAAGKKRCCK